MAAAVWPELAAGKPGPLYGVFGAEDFLRREILEEFIKSPAFAMNPMLNQEKFMAGETPPAKVLDSAATLPFLGSHRLVIVQDIDVYKADSLNQFIAYIDNPLKSTCLLFTAGRLDSRIRFAKALASKGRVTTVRKPYPRELPAWLQGRAAQRGKTLAPKAAGILSDLGEVGLMELEQEIEKLSLFTGSKTEIKAEDVHAVLAQGRLYSVFDLTNAITEGDLAKSLNALNQLLAMNEAPLAILAMITRVVRQWGETLSIMQEQGPGQVQAVLRTPPPVTKALMAKARILNLNLWRRQLELLLKTDVAIKSSAASPATLMEALLFKLCAQAKEKTTN